MAYWHKKGRKYYWEARINGRTYSGPTPYRHQEKDRDAAERYEDRMRKEKERAVWLQEEEAKRKRDAKGKQRDETFDKLAADYWQTVGSKSADARTREEWLDLLVERVEGILGVGCMASEIDDSVLTNLLALRSQDFDKRIKADKPVPAPKLRKDGTPRKNAAKVKPAKEPRLIRPATVN